jgi:CAAX prenyl protease-like protein
MNLSQLQAHPAFPFVVPYVLFALVGLGHGLHPLAIYVTYALKTALVSWALIHCWKRYPLRWLSLRDFWGAVAVGLLGLAAWVLPYEFLSNPAQLTTAYDPAAHFENRALVVLLICIRVIGATFTVPLMEEIFIRGFLQRYLCNSQFDAVPIGSYTHFSFWFTTVVFAITHGSEWHVAFIVGIIFGVWYIYTRSLSAVVVAHAVTNFALAIYVIVSGKTYFW